MDSHGSNAVNLDKELGFCILGSNAMKRTTTKLNVLMAMQFILKVTIVQLVLWCQIYLTFHDTSSLLYLSFNRPKNA